MNRLVLATCVVFIGGLVGGLLFADDRNADIGPGGTAGISTAWDSESIDVLSGNVHLAIPLYSVLSGESFGMSVTLHYDSKVWDGSSSTYPNKPGNRNLIAKSVFGLGWKTHLGRLYTLTYSSGTPLETFYFFQGMDGSTHRLFRKGYWQTVKNDRGKGSEGWTGSTEDGVAPYRVIGVSICDHNPDASGCDGGPDPRVCVMEDYWYAYDGSGIRAKWNNPGWTVWMPDGTRYQMTRFMDNDLNTPEQVNYKGYYTTSIESAVRKADGSPLHWINISYVDPADTARRFCPDSISDDLGRTVTFDCQATTAGGTTVDGGVVRSITVPAPHGGTLTYVLDHSAREIYDPIDCPNAETDCGKKTGVLMLNSITAQGVLPQHTFQFSYDTQTADAASPTGFRSQGEITQAILPGGGKRRYTQGEYRVWRKDYPIVYDSTSAQFSYFPVRGLIRREIEVDGRTWRWDYARFNDPGCGESTASNCYNHPIRCEVTGPYDPNDPTISGSLTAYNYHATKSSATTPAPKDGLVQSIQIYQGPPGASPRLLRTTSVEYQFDTPLAGSCGVGTFYKDHYADNLRATKVSTSFDDDGKPTHDLRVVENLGWVMLTQNFGRFQELKEYKPDGITPYRSTMTSYALTQTQKDAWVLTPVGSVQIRNAAGVALAETDYSYLSDGRLEWTRRLYVPGSSGPNDVLTILSYDPTNGNANRVDTSIPAQAGTFSELIEWQAGGYVSKRRFSGTDIPVWYSLDMGRDQNTGLPVQIRQPWGTGITINYDNLGRQKDISPLPGSGEPPVSQTYASGEIRTIVGDALSQSSVQAKAFFDGLGRIKEEQVLKYNDLGADQWVGRTSTWDALGNVLTASEWAPVGSGAVPVTRTERWGTYEGGGGVVALDPLFRGGRIMGPDGSTLLHTYQGLSITTKAQGIQGGTTSQPEPIDSEIRRTSDIFGRLVKTEPLSGAGVVTSAYDELDRLVESRTNGTQPRSTFYDPLGRVTMTSDPERGKRWFGSHTTSGGNDIISPDGYNARGQIVRSQDAAGFSANPPYQFILTYDSASRLKSVETETEGTPPVRRKVADYSYDLSDHGNVSGSHLGRIGRMTGYDDAGNLVSQSDYYYQEQYGRLNQVKTVLGGWGVPYSMYYSYDALGAPSILTYPSSGLQGAPPATVLWMTRQRGFVKRVDSNLGAYVVQGAFYSDSGGLKDIIAGNGLKTTIVRDTSVRSRVREVKVVNTSGSALWSTGTYSYDGAGNIAGVGNDVFTYDPLGRLKEARVAGTSGGTTYIQYFSYDDFSNMTGKSESVNFGMPSGVLYNIDPTTNRILGLDGATNWAYREDGALRHDDTFDYAYDSAGRLAQIQVAGTEVGKYSYDGTGLRVVRRENNGKEVFYLRDPAGNILSQFSRPTGTTLTPQWDRDFVYLEDLRVGMIEEPVPSSVSWKKTQSTSTGISLEWYANPETDVYGYLVLRKSPGATSYVPLYSGSSPITTSGAVYLDTGVSSGATYTYKMVAVDNAGNQGAESAERIITFGDTVPPSPPASLQASPGNRKVTLTWTQPSTPPDLAGYYVYRRKTGSYGAPLNSIPITDRFYEDIAVMNGTTYYYVVKAVDTAGLLSAASNESSATPKSFYPVSLKESPPFGEDLDMLAEEMVEHDSTARSPYRLIGQSTSGKLLFLHSDHLGSVRLVTSITGTIVSNHKYLPYGEEIQPMRTLNPFRYAGYERDSESGMDYARARYYNPGRSRWLTTDPLGGGYEYGGNSPTNRLDPTGLEDVLACSQWSSLGDACISTGPGWGGGWPFNSDHITVVAPYPDPISPTTPGYGTHWGLEDDQWLRIALVNLSLRRGERTHAGGDGKGVAEKQGDQAQPVKKGLNCAMAQFAIGVIWSHSLAGAGAFVEFAVVAFAAGAPLMVAPTGGSQVAGAVAIAGGFAALGGALVLGAFGTDVLVDSYHVNAGTSGWSPLPEINVPNSVLSSAGCL